MAKMGLIAGEGMLPVIWAGEAKKHGVEVVTIGITPATAESELRQYSDRYHAISVGELNKIISTLQSEGITQAVMMGKVQKVQLYQGMKMDERLMRLLMGLKVKNDDAILLALVQEMASEGIHFVEQTRFMEGCVAREGVLISTGELPADLVQDMQFGFAMAKEIGRLDIGQTVVVRGGAVIAVEAIEGTDQTILRSGGLTKGAVVAKVSKPQQDLRFDMPTVGLTTMQNLVAVGARGLVVEADQTFFIQQDEVLQLARENGIAIMAMR